MKSNVTTQEEKQLVLIDICGRLPYGVKVFYKYKTWNSEKFATSIRLADRKIALSSKFNKEGDWFSVEEAGEILIKPYLRSIEDMTEEEKIDYQAFFNYDGVEYPEEYIDWLNKKMFDYRGLIPMGLAIKVTRDNNPYEE